MYERVVRHRRLLITCAVAPFVIAWMLFNVAVTVAVLIFGFFLWLTTRPLRAEMLTARARLTPRLRRRIELADDHVDEEFRRIVDGEASREH